MQKTNIDVSDYDQSGYDYREYWQNRQYDDKIEKHILSNLLPSFSEHLIDIGGSYGRFLETYHNKAKHITILDYSKQALQTAQSQIEAQNYHHISTQQGNVYELPFGDHTFDTVLLIRVIHHLERPSLALHEVSRVLRPQGSLILQYANKVHLKNRIKAWLKKQPELIDQKPVNLSQDGIFYQFHPQFVQEKLKENDFEITQTVSASNIRIPLLYRILPASLLVGIDSLLEPLFTRFHLGPSIFIVARKK
jgi:ubiquinone/menaquinone biosynthesis C-methylase UbiE